MNDRIIGIGKRVSRVVGTIYGNYTVIENIIPEKGPTLCKVECICGETKTVSSTRLVKNIGGCKSCAAKGENTAPIKSGTVFGRLTVIEKTIVENKDGTFYLCKCSCGNYKTIRKNALLSEIGQRTISCGCLQKELQTKKQGEVTLNLKYLRYKGGANKRNLEFNLSIVQFENIVIKNCFYCNKDPVPCNVYLKQDNTASYRSKRRERKKGTVERAWINLNGIDRVNNDLGYNINNCVPCCTECNIMKSVLTLEQFLSHIKRIHDYQTMKINNVLILKAYP